MTPQFKKFLIFLVSLGLGVIILYILSSNYFLNLLFDKVFVADPLDVCGFFCGYIIYPTVVVIAIVVVFIGYGLLTKKFSLR